MKTKLFRQLFICFTLSYSIYAFSGPFECLKTSHDLIYNYSNKSFDDFKAIIESRGHEKVLSDFWNDKVKLHEKLKEYYGNQDLSKDCADSIRKAFFAIRTAEDFISDDYYRNDSSRIHFPDHAFSLSNQHVQKHPLFKDFDPLNDLKSGDVILSKGKAYTSSAISSLGEFDTQFSHMSLVYRDPQGKLWTIESHIEVGTFVRPLEDHIKDKNFRTMIFRFEDEELSKRAAQYIFKKAKKASETVGNIFYDFGFDQGESDSLFCSEVVSHSFEHESFGAIKIPMFQSQLMDRKPEFVKKLGITVTQSFIPSDIEVDPRFAMISEWRNASLIQDNLEKDVVLQSMYEWSDAYNYQLVQGKGKAFLYQNVAWPLRRVPFLKKSFVDKLPLNMSRRLIGYFGVLESVGELLQEKLHQEEIRVIKERGFPLLLNEKKNFLNGLREEESTLRRSKLHRMFRPKRNKT